MKNGIFYLTALMVCALGMTACADGKSGEGVRQEGSGQELPETVLVEEPQEAESGQEGTVQTQEETAPETDSVQTQEETVPETDSVQTQEETVPETDSVQTQEETAPETEVIRTDSGLTVRFDEAEQNYEAEDGTVLLTVQTRFPVVTIPGREQAAEAINRYVRSGQAFQSESPTGPPVEETLSWAEEDYKTRGKDMWPAAYLLYEGYWPGRLDENVVSFGLESYSYMGGAHPNMVVHGFVFDTQTGEKLSFADVVEDVDAASETVVRFLLEETAKLDESVENGSIFFDGYEETLQSYPKEDKWYLGEDGFHIFIDTYEIAPYVAGNFDFVIPYGEADFLREKFKKEGMDD